jgi:hypothetical protein
MEFLLIVVLVSAFFGLFFVTAGRAKSRKDVSCGCGHSESCCGSGQCVTETETGSCALKDK